MMANTPALAVTGVMDRRPAMIQHSISHLHRLRSIPGARSMTWLIRESSRNTAQTKNVIRTPTMEKSTEAGVPK